MISIAHKFTLFSMSEGINENIIDFIIRKEERKVSLMSESWRKKWKDTLLYYIDNESDNFETYEVIDEYQYITLLKSQYTMRKFREYEEGIDINELSLTRLNFDYEMEEFDTCKIFYIDDMYNDLINNSEKEELL